MSGQNWEPGGRGMSESTKSETDNGDDLPGQMPNEVKKGVDALSVQRQEAVVDLLDYIPIGVRIFVMSDEDHAEIEFSNRQMERMISSDGTAQEMSDGYCMDGFIGVHPDDLRQVREVFRQGYALERFSVDNFRLRTRSGHFIWVTLDVALRNVRPSGRVYYGFYRDVSKEKELRDSLEAQRERHMEQTLVDTIGSLPACSVLYQENDNGDLFPKKYSDEFCQLKGCTQQDIREFNSDDGFAPVHPDDRKALKEMVVARRRDRLMHNAVYRIRTKKSGYKWVSVNYTHFLLADQKYLYAVYTDIDDLKKQEQQLEEQYNSAQAFMDSVSNTYMVTVRSNLTRNRVESIGGTIQLLPGSGTLSCDVSIDVLLNAMPKEEQRRECAALFSRFSLIRAFEDGTRTLYKDFQVRMSNGEVIWVHGSITLTRRPSSGDVVAFFSAANVNEEKLTDAIMSHLVTNHFDYISCIDVHSGRFVLFFSNNKGSGMGEIPSGTFYDDVMCSYNSKCVASSDVASSIEFMKLDNVRKALEHNDRIDMTFSRNDGEGITAKRVEFSYLDRESGLIALVQTDVTESQRQQIEQEEKLRRALDAAQQANAAKSDFLSRMSHDMRTPLNGIIGMVYLTGEMDLPQEVKENLKKIDTSSRFLLSLINDVLDMAKAESGKIELHPEPYDPQKFADYLDAVIVPLCREKNLKLIIDAQPIPGVCVVIDPLRNNQIFFNLLSNAVKFTPEGGTITYRLRERLTEDGKIALHSEVSDTGIGMSEEFQRHLFEPFVQENRNDNSGKRGSGLGLSIVKKLIELMGGTISAKSRSGEGTTFFLDGVFDCVPEKRMESKEKSTMPSQTDFVGRHVLLCEDHPLNQEIVKALLEEKGAVIDIADNGQVGVNLFRNSIVGFYSAILMDIRMPVMDGYEATAEIRSLSRADAKTVPIIAMTADAFEEDVKRCMAAGMNGHLAKPVDPDHMFTLLMSFMK